MTSFRHYDQILRNFCILLTAQKMKLFQNIFLVQTEKQQLFEIFFIFIEKNFNGKPQFFYQDSVCSPYCENLYKRSCLEVL